METALTLAGAALSFVAAAMGLVTVEWATKASRLRRRVEFLRAELAVTPEHQPRAVTLGRMKDMALAALVAIELVPTFSVGWRLGLTYFAAALSGVITWFLGDGPLAATLIAGALLAMVAGFGSMGFIGGLLERKRITDHVLSDQPFVPKTTRQWSLHRGLALLASMVSGVVLTTIGNLYAVTVAALAGWQPGHVARQTLAISAVTSLILMVLLAVIVFLALRREKSAGREVQQACPPEVARAWGMPGPAEPAAQRPDPGPRAESVTQPGAEPEPVPRRPLTARAVVVAWLLSRTGTKRT